MKKACPLIIFFVFHYSFINAQAQISFSKTLFDFGIIEEASEGNAEFPFTNTGNEPLIISNVNSSCGCLVPSYPKEPIKPGGKGIIKGHYDTKRIGMFEKTMTLTCNATVPSWVLHLKGEVKKAFTTIAFDAIEKKCGTIDFDKTASIVFHYKNTGTNKLYLSSSQFDIPEGDIFEVKISGQENMLYSYNNYVQQNWTSESIKSDTGSIVVLIKNFHGNTGNFERKIKIRMNAGTDVILKITGEFTGKALVDSVTTGINYGYATFYYQGGHLFQVKKFSGNGSINQILFYNLGQCTQISYYNYYNSEPNRLKTESFYQNGILIKKLDYTYEKDKVSVKETLID